MAMIRPDSRGKGRGRLQVRKVVTIRAAGLGLATRKGPAISTAPRGPVQVLAVSAVLAAQVVMAGKAAKVPVVLAA
jgi:hypothetical protein